MSLTVFFIVLGAAAMHAGWNAMLKLKLEPFVAMVLIHSCGTILALPAVFWFGFPKAEAGRGSRPPPSSISAITWRFPPPMRGRIWGRSTPSHAAPPR